MTEVNPLAPLEITLGDRSYTLSTAEVLSLQGLLMATCIGIEANFDAHAAFDRAIRVAHGFDDEKDLDGLSTNSLFIFPALVELVREEFNGQLNVDDTIGRFIAVLRNY